LLVDAQGIPVNVLLTKANRHDVTQLMPLIDGVTPIAGKRGRPLRKPACVQADRAYDSHAHRQALVERGIGTRLPSVARRMAAIWARPGGLWSARLHGCISSADCEPGMNGCLPFMRRFSDLDALSSAGEY
jgi:hypothetical protein